MDLPAVQAVLTENIRRLMGERGWAAYVLADFAGLSRAHLYAVLRGEKVPNLNTLARIASALDVEAWELLRPAEKPPTASRSLSSRSRSRSRRRSS